MKVGVISDVHSNRIALDAVLDDMPPVEALLCAGDVVGYNPWPADCVDTISDRATACVMGNHDRAVVAETPFAFNGMAKAGVEYSRAELNDLQRDWLAHLPDSCLACDGRVKIVHGHPDNPDHYTYPEEFDADMLGDEDVLVMGHTHIQHHETYDDGIVMNPGSVGQPRDGNPGRGVRRPRPRRTDRGRTAGRVRHRSRTGSSSGDRTPRQNRCAVGGRPVVERHRIPRNEPIESFPGRIPIRIELSQPANVFTGE